MATSTAATGLTVQQWDDKFFTEYMQETVFSRYFGTDENSVIHIKEDLTKKPGDSVTFALVNKLANDATTGSNTLQGSEEDLVSRSYRLYIDQYRHAVVVPAFENKKSAIDLRDAGKVALKDWAMSHTNAKIISALCSINGTAYDSASEAEKDAWLVDNADRVLFGALKSNNSSNDHSASLLNIDGTNDKLTANAVSLMKRMALTANPKIRPITVEGGKRFYVAFAHPLCFRDLTNDATIIANRRDTGIRMQGVKLFEGGDVEHDGVIIHEVDDMPILSGVGASSINVSPVVLCGAQASGIGYGKRWQSMEDEFDYGDKQGIGIRAWYDVKKLVFGSGATDTADLKQHGVVTGYFASVADS